MQLLLASIALLASLGFSSAFFPLPPPPPPPPNPLSVSRRDPSVPGNDGATLREHICLRPAKKEDMRTIQETILRNLMNPTMLDLDNFLCAEDHRSGALVGFGQIRPIGGSNFELASLHVVDSYRKRGLGSQLVRQLVKEFVSEHGPEQLRMLYLLTLASTSKFYENNGFAIIPQSEVPRILKAERAVGSFVQSFFGESLVCMQASTSASRQELRSTIGLLQ